MNYTQKASEAVSLFESALRTVDKLICIDNVLYDISEPKNSIPLIERVANEYRDAHAEFNQRRIDAWRTKGCRGERPSSVSMNTVLLDRMSDVILDKWLRDDTPYKGRDEEYPFLSERQLERRRSKEVPLSFLADTLDLDGVDRRKPTRRIKSKREKAYLDRKTKSRNRERKRAHEEFKSGKGCGVFTVDIKTGDITLRNAKIFREIYKTAL